MTDFEWRVLEPFLPNKPKGVPRVDDRRVLRLCDLAPLQAHDLASIPILPLTDAINFEHRSLISLASFA